MPITTVMAGDEGTAIIEEPGILDGSSHRFSWSSALAGAAVAAGVVLLLLSLGTGVGLSLIPTHQVSSSGFLTLGAIYFFASLAMGFAAGGHIAGRLIGPAAETDKEEEFRAGAHGIVVWALAALLLAGLAALTGGMAAGSAAANGALAWAGGGPALTLTPAEEAYWTDMLFRPAAAPMHASLAYRRYAQANTTATDAPPPSDDESSQPNTPMTAPSSNTESTPADQDTAARHEKIETVTPFSAERRPGTLQTITSDANADNATVGTGMTSAMPARNIAADKAEVARILEFDLTNGRSLTTYDKDRIAGLIAQDAGVDTAEAERRVDNAENRIRGDHQRTIDAARKVVRAISLWIAFGLLFGAIVSVMAAISARWEDDRITFGWPRRAEPG